MTKADRPVSEMTYEQAFNELAVIVDAMESQQQPLDDSVKMFKRGQELAQHCASLLDNAELRIKEIDTNKSMTGEGD